MAADDHVTLDDVRAAFAAEGLDAPPIPPDLADALVRIGPLAFGTSAATVDLYDVEPHIDDWIRNPGESAVLVGGSGRGRTSVAMHYFLARERFGLFAQVGWGGNAGDAEMDATRVAEVFEWAGRFVDPALGARQGRRVVAWLSELYGTRWAWVDPTTTTIAELDWVEASWNEVAASFERALESDDVDLGAGTPDDGPRLPTLAAFLRAASVDDAADMAAELPLPDAADERTLARIVSEWSDRQALANLLLHPILLPADYRWSTVERALGGDPNDYVTFAAVVGIQRIDLRDAPDDEAARIAARLVVLARSDNPLVAQRASVSLAEQHDVVAADDLLSLTESSDTTVQHNAGVGLVLKLGLAAARDLLAGAASNGDASVATWRRDAAAELGRLEAQGGWDKPESFASPFASTRLTYVPDLGEWDPSVVDR